MSRYFDLACDLWIIREFLTKKHWEEMNEAQRNASLKEQLDDELAGYELPDDYSAGMRAHVFADEDCDVWFACCNWSYIDAKRLASLIPLMFSDVDMAEATMIDNKICVMVLDGRSVVGTYQSGVSYASA